MKGTETKHQTFTKPQETDHQRKVFIRHLVVILTTVVISSCATTRSEALAGQQAAQPVSRLMEEGGFEAIDHVSAGHRREPSDLARTPDLERFPSQCN